MSETQSELKTKFDQAAEDVKNLKTAPGQTDKLIVCRHNWQ